MPDYIFDTTVLSNFASAGIIHLLEKRYRGIAFTTNEVVDELRRGIKAGYSFLEKILQQIEPINSTGWISIMTPNSPEENLLRSQFDQFLDPGEASCLALAVSRHIILITDDLAARRLAEKREVSLSGTLGLLVALVRQGSISLKEANTILAAMIQGHFRSPVDNLDEFINT
jgi:predicted nucleic acid-binding protein